MSKPYDFDTDPADYLDFMRGDCALFAQALADRTDLPLWGVFDAVGDLHHVFVYDTDTDTATDYRGQRPLDTVPEGMEGVPPFTFRPVSIETVEDTYGTYDDAEWDYAEEVVCGY